MTMFLVFILVIAAVWFEPLQRAFMANYIFNSFIIAVLLLGIIYNFRQVTCLYPELAWIDNYRKSSSSILARQRPPKLLASMATMLGERKDGLSLSTMAMRSLLDGIYSRLDESRDLSRYTVGLLIFLGLLGTFWGLLETVSSIGNVIAGLSVSGSDIAATFGSLKSGLEEPLKGMGTAFSSSLFGLAGSLVLGFLDLQAGQAQNRFYNNLEDWLSSLTRLSSGALPGDGEHSVPAYLQALLEQTAENLEHLQRTLTRGEESRITANSNLMLLSEKIGTMTDHMHTEQALMLKLAESHTEIKPILARLASISATSNDGGMDDSTRTHIRNLDIYMARLLDELSTGRDEIIQQIRSEIKLLARTIAALSEEADRQ